MLIEPLKNTTHGDSTLYVYIYMLSAPQNPQATYIYNYIYIGYTLQVVN